MPDPTTDPAATAAAAAPKPKQKVSLGRIVHHRDVHGLTHAAIVTKVHADGTASLHVFPHDAPSHHVHQVAEVSAEHDPESETHSSGWHWPKLL
ncbi:MAG TPA: hypothetical protein VGG49_13395 [Steroidobacteraceae bacterium]|jgi:hypothetical protein